MFYLYTFITYHYPLMPKPISYPFIPIPFHSYSLPFPYLSIPSIPIPFHSHPFHSHTLPFPYPSIPIPFYVLSPPPPESVHVIPYQEDILLHSHPKECNLCHSHSQHSATERRRHLLPYVRSEQCGAGH